jgi:hypothetical protein
VNELQDGIPDPRPETLEWPIVDHVEQQYHEALGHAARSADAAMLTAVGRARPLPRRTPMPTAPNGPDDVTHWPPSGSATAPNEPGQGAPKVPDARPRVRIRSEGHGRAEVTLVQADGTEVELAEYVTACSWSMEAGHPAGVHLVLKPGIEVDLCAEAGTFGLEPPFSDLTGVYFAPRPDMDDPAEAWSDLEHEVLIRRRDVPAGFGGIEALHLDGEILRVATFGPPPFELMHAGAWYRRDDMATPELDQLPHRYVRLAEIPNRHEVDEEDRSTPADHFRRAGL